MNKNVFSRATTPSTRSPLDTGKPVKEEEGGSVEDILQASFCLGHN